MANEVNNRVILTREQFTKNIDNAIDKAGLKGTQADKFKAQASSIFTSFDTQGQSGIQGADGRWNQTEAQNGASETANLYNIINSAMNGKIDNDTTNALLEAQNFRMSSPEEQQATINESVSGFEQMTPEEQANDILNDIKALITQNVKVDFDGQNITIDGKNINLDGMKEDAKSIVFTELPKLLNDA